MFLNNFKKKITVTIVVLLFLIALLALPVSADTFKDYIGNPTTPKQSKLNPEGAFTVSLFDGAATYSYPIEVPPATNNLATQLSLIYSSHSSSSQPSIVGTGWALSQSYIERDINSTLSPLSDDEFKLVLNGQSHDLIYVPVENRFHTKIETFLYIQNITGAPNTKGIYWLVRTRDGAQYRFGFNNDSEFISNQDPNIVSKWSLDLIKDNYNNSIFLDYRENPFPNDVGVVYPNTIKYNNDQKRVITFVYETSDRPDNWEGYLNGNEAHSSRRLSSIHITANNSLVRRYDLSYTTSSKTRRSINTITEFGNNNVSSLPSTTFTYFGETTGWVENSTWQMPTSDTCFDKINTDTNEREDEGVRLIDVNGDGLVDILKGKEAGISPSCDDTSTRRAWINNKNGWDEDDSWQLPDTDACFVNKSGYDRGIRLADVNGDGLIDIVKGLQSGAGSCQSGTNRRTWINNGGGWDESTTWRLPDSETCFTDPVGRDLGIRLEDVDGDGKVDVVLGKVTSSCSSGTNRRTWINTGNGWSESTTWRLPDPDTCFVNSNGEDLAIRLSDVNGDNLVDVVRGPRSAGSPNCDNNERRTWVNTGNGWNEDSSWDLSDSDMCFIATDGEDFGVRLMDVNLDGLVDIVKGKESGTSCNSGSQRRTWVNNGSTWTEDNTWVLPDTQTCFVDSNGENEKIRISDVNGDGLADVILSRVDSSGNCGTTQRKTWINKNQKSNLLKEIKNDLGGKLTLNYKESTSFNNKGSDGIHDLGFNLWLVKTLTKNNAMIGAHNLTSTVTYDYSGGLYDYSDKEFRGFNFTEEREGNKIIRHGFHQDDAKKGNEYRTEILNNSQNLFQKAENIWNSTSRDGYFITELRTKSELTFDGNTTNPKIKNTTFSYDNFSNTVIIHSLGDVSDANDDRFEYFSFVYNTTAWIVDKVKNYTLYSSNNATKVKETLYTYDNLLFGAVPVNGSLTNREEWLDNGQNPTTNFSYDKFGNKISETDANGKVTQFVYGLRDTTNTFVDRIINAKSHVSDYLTDLGTGNLLSETDGNNILRNYTYDVFGRKIKEILPFDSETYPTKEFEYTFDGNAPEKILEKKRETNGTANTFDEYTFYDGFGRVMQIKSESNNSRQIANDFYYDTFGRIINQSNSYFVAFNENYTTPTSSIKTINYNYDPIDRIVKIINQDTTTKNINYNKWNITATDENGNEIRYQQDAFEQIISARENNNGAVYTTSYQYNSAGELILVNDTKSNNLIFVYDSLGRRIKLEDPDLGTWNYTYDKVGNIIEQIDNRSTITNFVFDELNRITSKTSNNESMIYAYDLNKNNTLSKVEINGIATNFSYDERLRKVGEIKKIDGKEFRTNLTYDALDRIKTKTLPDGKTEVFNYSEQNQLSRIDNISDMSHNEKDLVVTREYNNSEATTYTYNDSNFRLEIIQTIGKQSINYDYDNKGNVVKINDTANSRLNLMGYDALDRLLSTFIQDDNGRRFNFTYDELGNILQALIDKNNLTFRYNDSFAHAPIKLIQSVSLNDTNKFIFQNISGTNVAWFGDQGNIVLKGTCSISANCQPPADSFIFKNAADGVVSHIDPNGNLCIETGDCSDNSANCNPSINAFIIQNSTNSNQSYIDFNGDLCLTGTLTQNGNP